MSNLDFYVATKDDGTSVADSIQPVTNAEPASETTFQRPSENLRTRTQAVRETLDHVQALQAFDRSWIIVQQSALNIPTVTWHSGTKTFTTNGHDFIITPAIVRSSSVGAMHILPALDYSTAVRGTFKVESKFEMFEGGGNIFFKMFTSGIAVPTVTVTGTAANVEKESVTITLEMPVGTTYTAAAAAINLHAEASLLVTASETGGAVAVNAALLNVTATRQRLYSANDGVNFYGTGGTYEPSFYIDHNSLTDPSIVLPEGCVLAVNTSSTRALLGNDVDITVLPTDMVIIDDDTFSYAGNSALIPIAKNVDDVVYLINGVVLRDGVATEVAIDPTSKTTYNAHVAGTADKHPLKAITSSSRPFVTVGSASGCDYTNLNTAIADADLVTHGGTVYIMPGDYTLTSTLTLGGPGSDARIDLVGLTGSLWGKTVDIIVPLGSGFPAITISAGGKGQRIENIVFRQGDNTQNIVYHNPATSDTLPLNAVTFKNCTFWRTGVAAGVAGAFSVVTGTAMTFEKCEFWGYSAGGGAAVDRAINIDTTSGTTLEVTLSQCKFWKHSTCVYVTGANPVKFVGVESCTFDHCGYATIAPVWTYLIYSASGGKYSIRNNSWLEEAVPVASEGGGFCSILGIGEISNNHITRNIQVVVPSSTAYCIYARASSTPAVSSDSLSVIRNTLRFTTTCCAGIFGNRVDDNTIHGFNPHNASQVAITLATWYPAFCRGNRIESAAAPTVAIVGISVGSVAGADKSYVTHNSVTLYDADHVGIYVYGNNVNGAVVDGNNILLGTPAAGGHTGIIVASGAVGTTVINNDIYGPENGIRVSAANTVVSGNKVATLDATVGDNGIILDGLSGVSASDCKITSNNIDKYDVGILLDLGGGATSAGKRTMILGNTITSHADTSLGIEITCADAISLDAMIANNIVIGPGATGRGILISCDVANVSDICVVGNLIHSWDNVVVLSNADNIGSVEDAPGPDNYTDTRAKNWSLSTER